jgi:cytochrome c oxidase assembly protein subunit 15
MPDPENGAPTVPRWLHRWAVLTACAALPLLVLGAEVTTKQVGMADPQSVRTPWYLFTLPKDELWARGVGLVIEHSHRLTGWAVGACSIVLALGLWFGARGSRARWLGWLSLGMVSAQGLLGIFRVQFNVLLGPNLALVHGLFAQLVFATLVGVAAATSPGWRAAPDVADGGSLRRLAALFTLLAYTQVVFGGVVRHFHYGWAQRVHVLLAFVVVAALVWLERTAQERTADNRWLRRLVRLPLVLAAVQVALGVEAWVGRFGSGVPVELQSSSPGRDLVRSAHVLVGALLFAAGVVLTLFLARPARVGAPHEVTPAPAGRRENGRVNGLPVGGVA